MSKVKIPFSVLASSDIDIFMILGNIKLAKHGLRRAKLGVHSDNADIRVTATYNCSWWRSQLKKWRQQLLILKEGT